jgi:FkbM family methyltransferase
MLSVQWRDPAGSSGWAQLPFSVSGNVKTILSPQRISPLHQEPVWTPSEWEAIVYQNHEKHVFDLLPSVVKPNQVIYDIGANIGQFALRFSSLIGQKGHVYCIEANPICVYFLQANLELNHVANCDILPLAISDQTGMVNFTINYGQSALGIGQMSPFYSSKAGHEVNVFCYALDDLIRMYDLLKPDFIKIDIEGAEGYAISGMERILAQYQPTLLIEIHGQGAARMTFNALSQLRYQFLEISSGKEFSSADEVLAWFPETVAQFLCTPL